MKILQIIPYFKPKRGEEVNVWYHLSQSLKRNGPDLTIITPDFVFFLEYEKTLKKNEEEIITFSCIFNISLFLVHRYFMSAYKTALTIITASKYFKNDDKSKYNMRWNHA